MIAAASHFKPVAPNWGWDIPAIWSTACLKWISRLYAGGTPDRENPEYWNEGTIPWLNSGAVNQWLITKPSAYITESAYRNSSAKWIPKGALVIALAGQGKTKGMVAQVALATTCNQSMAAIVPDKRANSRYLLWWLALNYETIRNLAGGEQRDGLNLEMVGEIPCPLPPVNEQRAIAEFLDRETARLDALVAEKERLLELLTEKRRALITRAVTRGLNPAATLRDSGLPWLGQIPGHWRTERSKWLFKERDERTENEEGEMLTVSHLTGVTPRSEKDVNMFEAETTEGYKICCKGDLAINTLWAWMGAMGVSPCDGIVSPAYNVYVPGPELVGDYLDALVRIPQFAQEVIRYSKGVWSSRLRLYPEGFFEVWLPVPPLEEQRAIISHISAETAKLDALRSAAERTMALLKERRAALIAAAVTGALKMPAQI